MEVQQQGGLARVRLGSALGCCAIARRGQCLRACWRASNGYGTSLTLRPLLSALSARLKAGHMKAQPRLAGGRRKLGRNGFRSDGVFPRVC